MGHRCLRSTTAWKGLSPNSLWRLAQIHIHQDWPAAPPVCFHLKKSKNNQNNKRYLVITGPSLVPKNLGPDVIGDLVVLSFRKLLHIFLMETIAYFFKGNYCILILSYNILHITQPVVSLMLSLGQNTINKYAIFL